MDYYWCTVKTCAYLTTSAIYSLVNVCAIVCGICSHVLAHIPLPVYFPEVFESWHFSLVWIFSPIMPPRSCFKILSWTFTKKTGSFLFDFQPFLQYFFSNIAVSLACAATFIFFYDYYLIQFDISMLGFVCSGVSRSAKSLNVHFSVCQAREGLQNESLAGYICGGLLKTLGTASIK